MCNGLFRCFRMALELFKAKGVEMVINNGEMTHYGLYRLAWADVRR